MSEHGQDRYAKEVRERWGDTEAYRESSRRTRGYAPADWQKINAELEEIEAAMAAALADGEAPDGLRAMDLAEPPDSTSIGGTTPAATPCTWGWRICIPPIRGSRATTRTGRRGWRRS